MLDFWNWRSSYFSMGAEDGFGYVDAINSSGSQ